MRNANQSFILLTAYTIVHLSFVLASWWASAAATVIAIRGPSFTVNRFVYSRIYSIFLWLLGIYPTFLLCTVMAMCHSGGWLPVFCRSYGHSWTVANYFPKHAISSNLALAYTQWTVRWIGAASPHYVLSNKFASITDPSANTHSVFHSSLRFIFTVCKSPQWSWMDTKLHVCWYVGST